MSRIHLVAVLFLVLLLLPTETNARIQFDQNGRWETTFDYPEFCSQRGSPNGMYTDCKDINNDGIQWNLAHGSVSGNYTQVTTDAKNPLSQGSRGARFWVGDGRNNYSGPIRVTFTTPQRELWIRWYMRYQEGFRWMSHGIEHSIHYNKTLYMRTAEMGDPGPSLIPSLFADMFRLSAQGTPTQGAWRFRDAGWNHTYGPEESDGSWHCFEIHIKMDTQSNPHNGVGRMWLNGQLMGEYTQVDYSDNNTGGSRNGWIWFNFNNNQNGVGNLDGPIGLNYAYVDYDDMVMYNRTPPNTDEHGNPFIGPIGWDGTSASPITSPAPPSSVTIRPPTGIAVY